MIIGELLQETLRVFDIAVVIVFHSCGLNLSLTILDLKVLDWQVNSLIVSNISTLQWSKVFKMESTESHSYLVLWIHFLSRQLTSSLEMKAIKSKRYQWKKSILFSRSEIACNQVQQFGSLSFSISLSLSAKSLT